MSLGQSAGLSDPGRKRRRNEDSFVCEPPLFAVADGMGGAQAGEIASRLAAAALRGEPRGDVVGLIQEANRRVYKRSNEDEAASGMGTTTTVALVDGDTVRIGHVGDSRAYVIRADKLEQLTEDHSLVGELVRSGKLSPEEADVHPQRSVITRALGTDPDVDVDAFSVPARSGDVFMLCSDGLTTMLDDATILSIVEQHRDNLRAAAKALITAANRAGGEDNITVVLFEVAEGIEDTAQIPAVEVERIAESADEATLTELEAVPTVSLPEPKSRAAARPRRRRRVGLVAVGAVLLVAAFAGGLYGLSRAHFVGATHDGHVAIYQGVPWDLFAGIHLYREVYESPLLAAQLSQAERRRLFDHSLTSYGSSLKDVRNYEQDAVP
jgi:PPM family protein phosphatase